MRLKDVCNINSLTLSEQTSPDYRFRYIDISNVDSDGKVALSEEMCFRDAPSRARRIVKEGDTIISTVRTYLKAIATVNFPVEDVIVSTGFAVCSPHSNVFPNYLAYSFRTDCFIDEVCKKSTGVSYPAITASALSAIEVPYCNEQMQSRIVTYLDTKTAAIDKRVAVLEKKQEVYSRLRKSIINRAVTRGLNPNVPLKDSGVEWIGKIPGHWATNAIKRHGNLIGGNGFKEEYQGNYCDDVRFIKVNALSSNISISRKYDTVSKALIIKENYNVIPKGSIVFAKVGAALLLNRFCILPFDSCIDNNMMAFIPANDIDNRWCRNTFSSLLDFKGIVNSGPIPSVNQNQIGSIEIPIPPLSEQCAIADYLDDKCAKIDAAVENIGKQIDALKRLKRALINEVVTGKRKV